MGFAFLFQLAEQDRVGDLWLVQNPSAWGFLTVGLLAGAGVIAILLLLRRTEDEAHNASLGHDPVHVELRAVQQARAALLSELDAAPPALSAALRPLLERPLFDYDERVEALVATARVDATAGSQSRSAERDALGDHRARLLAELEDEDDPRARALLEASLGDLETTLKLTVDLSRNRRLALLELRRMKTLLVSLPTRVRELASRQGLEHGEAFDVEAIALQLEGAVQNSSDLMTGTLRSHI
jgi:hypothetical protein